MAHALRFRALLAEMGLSHPEAAKTLHVSLRTLQNWLSGRHEVPYAAYKLLRLLRYMELPGAGWAGWHFSRGQLVTPEGRTISGSEGAWWSLLVRQARCFHALYQRSGMFERALMELAATPVPEQAGRAAVASPGAPLAGLGVPVLTVPPGEAGAAAQPPALNLLLEHFTTLDRRNGAKTPAAAINKVANNSHHEKGGVHG